MPLLCIVGEEDNLTTSGTWRSWQTTCQHLSLHLCGLVEYWVKKFIELVWLTAQESCLLINLALTKQVHGNLHHRCTRTLSVTSLEEPEVTLLNGELHILHIVVVLLQLILDVVQLSINLRHSLFHRRIFRSTSCLVDMLLLCPTDRAFLGNLLRSTDTCYHVLTLCIDQVLTIETVLTGSGITAEANTCSRSFAHITEHHCHDRNGCTPLCRNAFHLTIEDGTLVHPTVEHSADSSPKLIHRIGRELLARLLLDGSLEGRYQLLQLLNVHLVVE